MYKATRWPCNWDEMSWKRRRIEPNPQGLTDKDDDDDDSAGPVVETERVKSTDVKWTHRQRRIYVRSSSIHIRFLAGELFLHLRWLMGTW